MDTNIQSYNSTTTFVLSTVGRVVWVEYFDGWEELIGKTIKLENGEYSGTVYIKDAQQNGPNIFDNGLIPEIGLVVDPITTPIITKQGKIVGLNKDTL
jgi:hypothetical protein